MRRLCCVTIASTVVQCRNPSTVPHDPSRDYVYALASYGSDRSKQADVGLAALGSNSAFSQSAHLLQTRRLATLRPQRSSAIPNMSIRFSRDILVPCKLVLRYLLQVSLTTPQWRLCNQLHPALT
ncbi:hypothetical protein IG631_24049 [Alternaria alternata]|nr:hypothetical protein IG631_24049 [Alternaria alternata]